MAAKEEASGERKRKRRPSAEKRLRDTVEALLCNLTAGHLNEYDPDRYVGVSFNTSAYSQTDLDAVVMRSCRDHLLEEELIELAAGFRNHATNFGRRSRLRASPRLRNLIDNLGLGRRSLTIAQSHIIRIKQPVKGLPPAPTQVEGSRDLLSTINARLAVTDIRLDAGLEAVLKTSPIEDDGEDQDARDRKRRYAGDRTAKALYRAFKHDWGHGGRIYGGWWMSEKRVWRPYLRIDGQRTVELDYKVLHPRLLYRRAEAPMPSDPYLCGDWATEDMRNLGKRTFNRLLNRVERNPAKRLTMRAARGDPAILPKGTSFKQYLATFAHHLSEIQHWFGTGEGIRLQYEDSELAISVLRRMEGLGIVTLPTHDSFIVAKDHEAQLHNTMVEAFFELFGEVPAIDRKEPRDFPLSTTGLVHN
jgi:hypothetical protein